MLKRIFSICSIFLLISCAEKEKETVIVTEDQRPTYKDSPSPKLTISQANRLLNLPLFCVEKEYPNKPGMVLESKEDLLAPSQNHPIFYGCFDWHSSVHGYWSMIALLKNFPDLEKAEEVRALLKKNITKQNVQKETEYFKKDVNQSFQRTYGWSWYLKLVETLHTWDDPLARELENNLKPLTDLLVKRYKEFLPKLLYPIRVGEHTNTAFGLSFAYDFAETTGNDELKKLIGDRAKNYYFHDRECPISWEPSGFDFLSPCLEEVRLMQRVLSDEMFLMWLDKFLPQLKNKNYSLEAAEVSDREDGKLVHLDGVNFSRAWTLYALANKFPQYAHLRNTANKHVNFSLPNIVGDSYEGGHWLGSFAIYALLINEENIK